MNGDSVKSEVNMKKAEKAFDIFELNYRLTMEL